MDVVYTNTELEKYYYSNCSFKLELKHLLLGINQLLFSPTSSVEG